MGAQPRPRPFSQLFIRNVEAGDLLERFLVSAVAAVLLIRSYLRLTGYPRVGRGELHIAHMLWGGLLMLVAIALSLAFLGRRARHAAAIVGGLGFGTFIDELGKFITSDNDYFFHPTIALIYAVFVLLFLLSRAAEPRRALSPEEALLNAVQLVAEEVTRRDLDAEEAERALALLRQSDPDNPIAGALRRALHSVELVRAAEPNLATRLARRAHAAYTRLVTAPWFGRALIAVFAVHAALNLLGLLGLYGTPDSARLDVVALCDLISSCLASLLVLVGVAYVRRSRLHAYQWFKRSLLVSIFLVQIFVFYAQQLSALSGLLLDIALLATINRMLDEERRAIEQARAEASPTSLSRDYAR